MARTDTRLPSPFGQLGNSWHRTQRRVRTIKFRFSDCSERHGQKNAIGKLSGGIFSFRRRFRLTGGIGFFPRFGPYVADRGSNFVLLEVFQRDPLPDVNRSSVPEVSKSQMIICLDPDGKPVFPVDLLS